MQKGPWVTEQEASVQLGVSERTLQRWREVGYLKPGTHWRSAASSQPIPWRPEAIYHLRWCQEEMDHWREKHAPLSDIAA